jgi:hypothetical protein
VEYALEIDGFAVGYGSVAIGGPWTTAPSLYEFYVTKSSRQHVFDLFAALRAECKVSKIETQTFSSTSLTSMLSLRSEMQVRND